jgi:hypothetical protein
MNAEERIMSQLPQTPAPYPTSEHAGSPFVAAPVAMRDPRMKSVALACFLSFLPGLGQVYVGHYRLGFAHILTMGAVVSVLAIEALPALAPLLGFFVAFFYLYNIVDAGRRASLYNQALLGIPGFEAPRDVALPSLGGSLAGGIAVIGIGAVLLSNTAFGLPLDWLERWWPVAVILFGAHLVYRWSRERVTPAG